MNGAPTKDRALGLPCSHCGKRLDECAFCDEADCNAALCYECVVVEVGQSLSQPHRHGG